MRCATAAVAALLLTACSAPAPHRVSPTPTTAPKPVATTPPPPAAGDQAISVARAIFAQAFDGGYLECDAIAAPGFDLSNCPMSSRLVAQINRYQANRQKACPQGCGGTLLIIRDQCGSFPAEAVTGGTAPSVAVVQLSGDTTCRGIGKSFYVTTVIENGVPVADDIECNLPDPRYGMYNRNANATAPPACAAV